MAQVVFGNKGYNGHGMFASRIAGAIVFTGDNMRNRVIVCLGFSACLLIGTLTLWGGLSLGGLTGLDISDILKYWSVPLQLALSVSLFSVLLKRGAPSKTFITLIAGIAGLLIIAGCLLLFLPGDAVRGNIALVASAAAVIGLGYGLLLLLWLYRLSRFSDGGVIKVLLVSLVVSSATFLILLFLLPAFESVAFVSISLVSVVLCAVGVEDCTVHDGAGEQPVDGKRAFSKSILELRDPLFCVCAIAVAVALTRAIALDGIEDGTVVNIATSIGTIAAAAVLYLMWFGFGKDRALSGKQNIPTLYRVFFPLIATALLLLSVLGSSFGLIVAILVFVIFAIVSALIMSTSITTARKQGTEPLYVYGVFAGCMYFAAMVATILGGWVYYPKNFGAATTSVIVLLVLYILAMSYVAIQNRRKRSPEEDSDTGAAPVAVPAAASPETTVIDEVAQRCTILAERNHVTTREQDILLLIARGRDVPSISKQLFISENTVRSHSKNVYKKLGIHSKQELLDLLETVPHGSE